MIDVVSVKFKGRGKTYFFDPNGVEVREGDQVVVETSKGLELADCVQGNHTVNDDRIVPPLRPVIRVATADDLRVAELGKEREKEAFAICEKKIAEHRLDMKLVDVECNFEGNKILFFFTSDGRVDFRELVKDLAGIFRTRIELRQIGVRDEAKMLGGLGMCGRPFCCHQFLEDFEPVSTKMAKTQSLSLNPTKISGCCGRLMCCLRYEQEAYEELVKTVPKNGAFVETPDGYGNVTQVNLLRQKVKVKLDGVDEAPRGYEADEVATVPGGRPKPGEVPPHVLELKPKETREEPPQEDAMWAMPLFAEDTAEVEEKQESPGEEKRPTHRRRRSRGGKKPSGGDKPGQSRQSPENKPQKQEKKSEAPGGEEDRGAGNGGSARRGRRSGGRNKPQSGGQNAEAKQQEKKPQSQPGPASGGEGAPAGDRQKKKNRRHYRGKPKPKSGGEGQG